jgi:plasmid stabilization system protein ParE
VGGEPAGGAVAADFGQAVALLAGQPHLGAPYLGSRTQGVRRLFLNRVGYFIYYKQQGGDLQILAFWHSSRENQPVL